MDIEKIMDASGTVTSIVARQDKAADYDNETHFNFKDGIMSGVDVFTDGKRIASFIMKDNYIDEDSTLLAEGVSTNADKMYGDAVQMWLNDTPHKAVPLKFIKGDGESGGSINITDGGCTMAILSIGKKGEFRNIIDNGYSGVYIRETTPSGSAQAKPLVRRYYASHIRHMK